jgi:hypothetical protein
VWRIYTGPEPADGPHPGYRCRNLKTRDFGVLFNSGDEYLHIPDIGGHSWESLEVLTIVPWHCIDLIEKLPQ